MPLIHRVRAVNLATTSSNKIHDDEVARRYGFAGGLVPGVDVYAYTTHAAVAAFGDGWLSDGAIDIKLVKPVYDGRGRRWRSTRTQRTRTRSRQMP